MVKTQQNYIKSLIRAEKSRLRKEEIFSKNADNPINPFNRVFYKIEKSTKKGGNDRDGKERKR